MRMPIIRKANWTAVSKILQSTYRKQRCHLVDVVEAKSTKEKTKNVQSGTIQACVSKGILS